MKQEVLITLRGSQQYEGGKPEAIELMTRGVMLNRGGKYSISYTETELTGTPGVVTTFFIPNPQRVVLTREGPIKSRMVFVEGVKDEALYDLNFGSLLVGICARKIVVDLHENGGRLQVDYTVEIEQAVTSRNSYLILVEPVKADEKSEP